jgi:hypothetical protein
MEAAECTKLRPTHNLRQREVRERFFVSRSFTESGRAQYRLLPFCARSDLNYIQPMSDHIDRYVPAETNGGWGVAAGVILFTVLCIATVTYIHKQTYRHPTDVTWHGKGSGDAAPPSAREAGR